jgi:hypothetical protein
VLGLNKKLNIIILIIFLLVILIAPYGYHIDLGPGPNGLFSILWEISVYYGFRIFESFEYFPYYIFRFVIFHQLFKLLHNKNTKKRFLFYGVINELILLFLSLIGVIFISPEGENFIPIMINIPILLVCCIFVYFWKVPSGLQK